MVTKLAADFAARLNVTDELQDTAMDVDSDSETSSSEGSEEPQEIRFQGRQNNRVGFPLRVFVKSPLPVSSLRDGEEPVTIFEESKHDYIQLDLTWPGYGTKSKLISVKNGKRDPIALRTLAEEVAKYCLSYMQEQSGDYNSENPTLGNVSFYQVYLVALHRSKGPVWKVEIQA
ncbi:uncharacterized protein B0H18DRAFT_955694 [Fomitopsis serialis]|uniref:uncharacterized protein n=1 Tax=Fomitopsis serialis TaxID=139415 RepID=UPI002007DD4B|nr:uncharacterized protein B0H18DRAFT_955694 [Neoantrodia serialis]KAH9923849.1 hypothetical protein B0H18DRAFT_955694 [Neoantrodia serialis]